MRLDTNAVCQTNTILTGVLEWVDTSTVRLDSAASLSWNAYQGFTLVVGVSGLGGSAVNQARTISSYAGNVTGSLTAVTPYNSVTVSLLCTYCAVGTDFLYNGAQIDIDVDGNPLSGDDIYSGTITSYTAAGVVTCSGNFIRVNQRGVTEIYSASSGRVMSTSSTYTIYSRV